MEEEEEGGLIAITSLELRQEAKGTGKTGGGSAIISTRSSSSSGRVPVEDTQAGTTTTTTTTRSVPVVQQLERLQHSR